MLLNEEVCRGEVEVLRSDTVMSVAMDFEEKVVWVVCAML